MNKERAVTLVEFIVAVAIFALVATGLLLTLNYTRGSMELVKIATSLEEEMQNALYTMASELRQTRNSKIAVGPVNADGVWYDTIRFSIPWDINGDGNVVSATGELEWSDQGTSNWTVTYALSGFQLLRTSGDGRNPVLASHITAVSFRRQAGTPGLVDITLTGQMTTYLNRTIQISLTNSVEMRN